MSSEEVLQMAHEAGFGIGHAQAAGQLFEQFAALVAAKAVAKEREACALACEANAAAWEPRGLAAKESGDIESAIWLLGIASQLKESAAAIRARGQP